MTREDPRPFTAAPVASAYVVVFFDITGSQPVAVAAGVRSASAEALAGTENGRTALNVVSVQERDYAEAESAARQLIATQPAYAWVRPLLDRERRDDRAPPLLSGQPEVARAEVDRLAVHQDRGGRSRSGTVVQDLVAEIVVRSIREAAFLNGIKETIEASLVAVVARRVAEHLKSQDAVDSACEGTFGEASVDEDADWSRPGWILGSRTRNVLEAAAGKSISIAGAVSAVLEAWHNYETIADDQRVTLEAWALGQRESSTTELRELAAAIREILAAAEARGAFLATVSRGWVSRHGVQIDLVAVRTACEMIIQYRPRDGSRPHATISADVLLAVVTHALALRDGVQAASNALDPLLMELSFRGPVVSGDGAPDADGSVVVPALSRGRMSWSEL